VGLLLMPAGPHCWLGERPAPSCLKCTHDPAHALAQHRSHDAEARQHQHSRSTTILAL
jgi:hypothetical protein